MSVFASTMITDAPWSSAETAPASPAVPAPIVTKSASRSHTFWASRSPPSDPPKTAAPTPGGATTTTRELECHRLRPVMTGFLTHFGHW